MVDGVAGEAIQLAPKTAVQDVKQNHEHVLIRLQLMVEMAVLDHRLLRGTVILSLAVRVLSKQFFCQIAINPIKAGLIEQYFLFHQHLAMMAFLTKMRREWTVVDPALLVQEVNIFI